MNDPIVISTGMNQRIGALVVEFTHAKNRSERLNALDKLAADADSHVEVYLREIGDESPSIQNLRIDLQNKLAATQATKPEEEGEDMDLWNDYMRTTEHQLEHVADLWGDRVTYRAFVERWDRLNTEWLSITGAMSAMTEGGMAQVFDARRKPRQDVKLPPAGFSSSQATRRDLMVQVMGLRDFGQENITSNIEIVTGIDELDIRMISVAGKFSAIFAEIFGDLDVYAKNYFQYIALKKAEEKGRLEEYLRDQEIRGGAGE
jgi:hypothetical protein